MEIRFKLNLKLIIVAVLAIALVLCLWSLYQQGRRHAANINALAAGINQLGAILGHNIQQGHIVQLPPPPGTQAEQPTPEPAPEVEK